MKLPLLLITVLIPAALFAQTTRRTNEDLNTKEVFYVLKSDKNIKEGTYFRYTNFGNKLVCEGFYKNNLKDSLWKYYSFRVENKLSASGSYKSDKRVGLWNFYTYTGDLRLQYDYTDKKVLFVKGSSRDSSAKFNVISGADTVKTLLERPPIFLESDEGFGRPLFTGLRYPLDAKNANIQGKVLIAFTIDQNGNVSNYRVKKELGYGCDEEALNAVKRLTAEWLPGMLNGNPVVVEYEIPISFTLSNQ
jgi:TonB family protein